MTPISKPLKQRSALCERAVEQTRNIVHGMTARAFIRVSDAEHDLGASTTSALGSLRLAVVA